MDRQLPRASILESLGFTLLAVVPNALQGLFRRRERIVSVASRLGVDSLAIGIVGRLRDHADGSLWVRVLRDPGVLALSTDDVRSMLEGSPDPFAPDPEAKRRGMSHFQPHALTLSRGELWRNRRAFTEAVLDTTEPVHRLADRFVEVCRDESAPLLDLPQLNWKPFHAAFRRIARRVILGDSAADDERVTDLLATLMSEANSLPKERSEHFEPFTERLGEYVEAAEEGSLVALFAQAPSDERTEPAGQVPHWLFATADTLPANAFRALALIAAHPRQRSRLEEELADGDPTSGAGVAALEYLKACIEEAMRLWPTTPLLSREALRDTELNGAPVPAGTQLFIHNTFNHRDRVRHDYADRFAPEEWIDGSAAQDWAFNHFSHGPQGCPGAGLALLLGRGVLAHLLAERSVRLLEPSLDPDRPLPRMLDVFRLRFALPDQT